MKIGKILIASLLAIVALSFATAEESVNAITSLDSVTDSITEVGERMQFVE